MAMSLPETSNRTSPLPFLMPSRSRVAKPASLVEVVQSAVQEIPEGRLQPISARLASLAFQPRVMLAVLTYCYARQVYAASEVINYLYRDAAFREVCCSEFPSTRELRLFRQKNRSLVEQCLTQALRFQGEQKVAEGFVTRIHETFIAEEAKRRIITAACMDSLEMECAN